MAYYCCTLFYLTIRIMSTPTVFKMFWYLRFKRSSLYYKHRINNNIP